MARATKELTLFGKDLDALIQRAGGFSLREYADRCCVNYKYLIQLRTLKNRRPGRLYVDFLKPFISRKIIDLDECQRLSLRHRGKPLTFKECKELFPELEEPQFTDSLGMVSIDHENHSKFDGINRVVQSGALKLNIRTNIHRHIFVGRQDELNELHAAFSMAKAGKSSVFFITGEPGIGKSTLCRQLADYVNRLGGQALVGRCYEMASMSLPYQPFVEILRLFITSPQAVKQNKEIDFYAKELARIVPEINGKVRSQQRRKSQIDEKFRLFQAVTDFIRDISGKIPLLIVLEDLHGADNGTLEMLQYLIRNPDNMKVLIVGTYRDTEVTRTHPLSALMADLRRFANYNRIELHGLDVDEATRMFSGVIGRDAPMDIGGLIHGKTEGNPLFVEEVASSLLEKGIIDIEKDLRWQTDDISTYLEIPSGLKDFIGKRLSGLSNDGYKVLSVASVIGRDFRSDILEKIISLPEKRFYSALDEGLGAALIEEYREPRHINSYRFTHTFFWQTLYEDIIIPRRSRLHHQVGSTLESLYGPYPHDHALELAEHFSLSSDTADRKKAVKYSELAAKRAVAVYAYSEAVKSLKQALRIHEKVDPSNKRRHCDLLISVCEVLVLAGEPRHVLDNEASIAFSLAEELHDKKRAASVCRIAMWALYWEAGSVVRGTPEQLRWIERTYQNAEINTVASIWADLLSGLAKYYTIFTYANTALSAEGVSLMAAAIEAARRTNDLETIWVTAATYMIFPSAISHGNERLRLAGYLSTSERPRESLFSLGLGLVFSGYAFLEAGDRSRSDPLWTEHQMIARKTGQAYYRINSIQIEGQIALLDGRLEDAAASFLSLIKLGRELDLSQFSDIVVICGLARPLLHLGRATEVLQFLSPTYPWLRAVCFSHLGRNSEVRELLAQSISTYPEIGTEKDELPVWGAIGTLEAAVTVGDKKVTQLLLDRLQSCSQKTTGVYWLTCIPRNLGGAAALLGRYDEACQHYKEAIRVCTEMRFRPELALSRLQLAELLLEHYPDKKKDAQGHLDFAIKEFREMKMQPSLERALKQKEILQA